MSAPHIEQFLDRSTVLDGNPTFNSFMFRIANKGFVGEESAGRIRYYGGALLSNETIGLLKSIENQSGPELHPLSSHILPIVRTADDFEIGEAVYVRVPERNSELSINYVSGIEAGLDEDSEGDDSTEITEDFHPSNPRGLVLIEKHGFGYYGVLPQWPAIIPEQIVTALDHRTGLEATKRRAIAGFANSYFQSCFFDRLYVDSKLFRDNAHRTPRNLKLITYTRGDLET